MPKKFELQELSSNIKQDFLRYVPGSLVSTTSCFVLYDRHPCDGKKLDIVVCTSTKEVIELFQRNIESSIILDTESEPTEISLYRNTKGKLFYLVSSAEELYILTSNGKLGIHHKISNVESYSVNDFDCNGKACLKVTCSDDAVPLLFDENFDHRAERPYDSSHFNDDDDDGLVTELKRKLIAATYNLNFNKKSLEEFRNLRQLATFSLYQSIHPNLTSSVFANEGLREIGASLKLQTETPWIKVCNKKVVILLCINNTSDQSLEDMKVLLHGNENLSSTYTTKLYESISHPPFWNELKTNILIKAAKVHIAVIISLKELQKHVGSRIDLNGVITYKNQDYTKFLPFETIHISALDTMGEEFDVLHGNVLVSDKNMLAALATTEKFELSFRLIEMKHDKNNINLILSDMLVSHLKMERVNNDHNMIIHKISPYHPLNGLMLVFHEPSENFENGVAVTVHARCSDQVISLIHHINDSVPSRLLITTSHVKITAKDKALSIYNEEPVPHERLNIAEFANSLLKQTSLILEYYDRCMMKMNESKNEQVLNKIGSEIDIYGCGAKQFYEIKEKLNEEILRGIKSLYVNSPLELPFDSEVMIIDSGE